MAKIFLSTRYPIKFDVFSDIKESLMAEFFNKKQCLYILIGKQFHRLHLAVNKAGFRMKLLLTGQNTISC